MKAQSTWLNKGSFKQKKKEKFASGCRLPFNQWGVFPKFKDERWLSNPFSFNINCNCKSRGFLVIFGHQLWRVRLCSV